MLEDGILTLDDVDVEGKTVLVRSDINSPIDPETKEIVDKTRIERSIPTLKELIKKNANTVLLAHQGDPLTYQNFTSLANHADLLNEYLDGKVTFIEDTVGPAARKAIKNVVPGQVLLLENVRTHTEETIVFEEEANLSPEDQANTYLVKRIAPLGDIYICDAFAAVHRSEPTLVGLPKLLPSYAGRLFEEEMTALTKVLENPQQPCLFLLGGAKILDAFKMMERVLSEGTADKILTYGLLGQVMLKANGTSLGKESESFLQNQGLLKHLQEAKEILRSYREKIESPLDIAVNVDGERKELSISQLPTSGLISDIGEKTVDQYKGEISTAETIFMNGPAGIYEEPPFAVGTRQIWQYVASSPAYSVIGGGDTVSAARKFGVQSGISYICTAGGGLIRFISGEELPVITALQEAAGRN